MVFFQIALKTILLYYLYKLNFIRINKEHADVAQVSFLVSRAPTKLCLVKFTTIEAYLFWTVLQHFSPSVSS